MLARTNNTGKAGNMQATLNGTTLTFTINIGPQGLCPTTVDGTAQATNTSINGTYTGMSCNGPITDGRLMLSRQ
jgi:hypothetical protein